MGFVKVRLEWRRGVIGEDGTFVFNPKPTVTRISPGKRTAILTVPLQDGAIVQNLGLITREIILRGVLFTRTNNWDDMETLRNNLRDGLGTGPGQLHIISPQRHIRYDGQITTSGLDFEAQERSNLQDYIVTIIVPNSKEINVTDTIQTINSDAEVA